VSESTQRVWSALVAVYQPVLRHVVAALEREAGIDSGSYSVLAYLDRAGGRMPLRELQELMRVRYSQPGLSRLVQRLERERLVARMIDTDDRRATIVRLTPTGRVRFRRAHDVYTAALDEHLGRYLASGPVVALTEQLERLGARVGGG
jgi:DNA-binding MarR family transcriptional regulator